MILTCCDWDSLFMQPVTYHLFWFGLNTKESRLHNVMSDNTTDNWGDCRTEQKGSLFIDWWKLFFWLYRTLKCNKFDVFLEAKMALVSIPSAEENLKKFLRIGFLYLFYEILLRVLKDSWLLIVQNVLLLGKQKYWARNHHTAASLLQ